MNDGGSADYYTLPEGASELQDLIEAKDMNFAVGNIFKAAYRLGAEGSHSTRERDLRKIIWFAERELARAQDLGSKKPHDSEWVYPDKRIRSNTDQIRALNERIKNRYGDDVDDDDSIQQQTVIDVVDIKTGPRGRIKFDDLEDTFGVLSS